MNARGSTEVIVVARHPEGGRRFIAGEERKQLSFLPTSFNDYVEEDTPFSSSTPSSTGSARTRPNAATRSSTKLKSLTKATPWNSARTTLRCGPGVAGSVSLGGCCGADHRHVERI